MISYRKHYEWKGRWHKSLMVMWWKFLHEFLLLYLVSESCNDASGQKGNRGKSGKWLAMCYFPLLQNVFHYVFVWVFNIVAVSMNEIHKSTPGLLQVIWFSFPKMINTMSGQGCTFSRFSFACTVCPRINRTLKQRNAVTKLWGVTYDCSHTIIVQYDHCSFEWYIDEIPPVMHHWAALFSKLNVKIHLFHFKVGRY